LLLTPARELLHLHLLTIGYYRINIEDKGELMGKNIVFVASTHTDEELLEVIRVGSALANG
jgi:hypothetical protein